MSWALDYSLDFRAMLIFINVVPKAKLSVLFLNLSLEIVIHSFDLVTIKVQKSYKILQLV